MERREISVQPPVADYNLLQFYALAVLFYEPSGMQPKGSEYISRICIPLQPMVEKEWNF